MITYLLHGAEYFLRS